ncbi:hypothetical protein H0W26_04090 [Candidatus Dependentiae bacterium]|nr:hypothetical protein [Candidatus Dependentiae bacterium]
MALGRGRPKEIDSELMHSIPNTLPLPKEAEQNITNAGNQRPLNISSESPTKEKLKPIPNDEGTIASGSEPDPVFLPSIPQKVYSFLWKDASCVQTVSEIILVGVCIGAIAYTYNESFRKRMQNWYKSLGNETPASDKQEHIISSTEETSSPIAKQDVSRKEEEQPLKSSSTNDHLPLEAFPLEVESL